MRQDVHCAYDVQSMDYNSTNKGFTLSLTEVYGTCASVDSSGPTGSQVQLQWCTAPAVAGSTTLYNLYRGNTSCNTSSTPVVRNIVTPSGGWPTNSLATSASSWNGNIWPDVSTVSGVSSGTCTTDYLKTLPVDFAINDYSTSAPNATYELKDNIALRNSTRCNTTSGGGSGGGQSRPTLSLSVLRR